MAGTPVLATSIAGIVGMLGDDYPGYFPVGDTHRLTELLIRCEESGAYYSSLARACKQRRPLFTPERERQDWDRLIREL